MKPTLLISSLVLLLGCASQPETPREPAVAVAAAAPVAPAAPAAAPRETGKPEIRYYEISDA